MTSQTPNLILASQSPRRRQLLTEAGFEFTIVAPHDSIEQAVGSAGTAQEIVKESAFVKAQAVAQQIASGIVLAADTVAHCGSKVLGKPDDRNHAEQMLRLMSGQQHQVLTGVCLWHRPSDHHLDFLEQTTLRMDPLSERQLEHILDSNAWIGKAGAFGFQDGLDWVHIESGLESNVVGLPIEKIGFWIDELLSGVDTNG